ncbi:hypothetical protein A4U49_11595 [Acidithiobacillus ferrivorans]|nr:hypothetical protein A4U49_11595 [Acidithiobacillus ferrivorans]
MVRQDRPPPNAGKAIAISNQARQNRDIIAAIGAGAKRPQATRCQSLATSQLTRVRQLISQLLDIENIDFKTLHYNSVNC